MSDNKTLKEFMSQDQRTRLGKKPTWHSICLEMFGVARPGKTARDRARNKIS